MAGLRLFRHGVLQHSAGTLHLSTIRQTPILAMQIIDIRGSFSNISNIEGFLARLLRNKQKSPVLDTATNEQPKQVYTNYVDGYDQQQIDKSLKRSIDCNDRKTVNILFDEIIARKQLPSDEMTIQLLSYLCDKAPDSMDKISLLIDICQQKNIAFYAKNMVFAPFLAQYLWRRQHFDDALKQLNKFYLASKNTRPATVRQNYRQIIFDAVRNQDEIVLQKVIDNTKFVFKRYKEPALLMYVWGDCFCSDQYRNQVVADEIFDTIEIIRTMVVKDISWIVLSLLHEHNVDAMHRLIELCLKFEWREECSVCLFALFDYHCKCSYSVEFFFLQQSTSA